MTEERVDRAALERIIRRAAELQAAERDVGEEGLSRDEVVALGKEVGIPARHLRQAMLEEETRSPTPAVSGFWGSLAGPAEVGVERVVPGDKAAVERALQLWMQDEELMQVKRRFPDRITWEPKAGFIASMQRGLKVSGRSYALAESAEVAGRVTPLEPGFCHVRLTADVRNLRRRRAAAGVAVIAVGWLATLAALSLDLAAFSGQLVALVPATVATVAGLALARTHRVQAERVTVGLEQVLDRLERGEIRAEHRLPGPRASAFLRMADEIRKTFQD